MKTERISVTSLNDFLETPYHFWYWNLSGKKKEPTDAMIEGRAFHMAVLEPEKFKQQVRPKSLAGEGLRILSLVEDLKTFITENEAQVPKGAKKPELELLADMIIKEKNLNGILTNEMFEEYQKKMTIVTDRAYEKILSMKKSVESHPWFLRNCQSGESEIRLEGEIEGMKVVGRLDRIFKKGDRRIIIDLKKSMTVKPRRFFSKIAEMNYHVQAWCYYELVRQSYNEPSIYAWVATEGDEPFITEIFSADGAMLDAGEVLARYAIKGIKERLQSGEWPAYSSGNVISAGLPSWAFDQANEIQDRENQEEFE